MSSKFEKYGKALSAVGYFVAVAVYAATSGDNHVDPDEGVAVAIALVNAVGVYLIPLAPGSWGRSGKTVVNVLLAVLQVATTVILGGLDANEWILLALTALGLLGGGLTNSVSDNGISSKSSGRAPDAGPPPVL